MDSFKDGRVAAGILAVVSALTLTATVLRRHALASSKDSKTTSAGPGTSIIVFRCTRAVATLALCALSYYTTAALEVTELGHWALAAAITYSTLLVLAVPFTEAALSSSASLHATLVLSAVALCYGYRDVWPLMTYTLEPRDASEGPCLWIKTTLLIMVVFVLPALEPYQVMDANTVHSEVNPEQTASLLSWATFTYLDPVIFKAYRVPHLPTDEFPPMCSYDRIERLIARSHRYMDPFLNNGKEKTTLFRGLLRAFRTSLIWQSLWLVVYALSRVSTPYGTRQLLQYLETRDGEQTLRPWVWLAVLFGGRLIRAVSWQVYIFFSTGSLVRVEAIITSLVFEHSLRVRMKSALPGEKSKGDDGTKGKGKKGANKTKDDNLVGKITSHITSDLNNITAGRDFLFLLFNIPIVFTLGMVFLYSVLGWSSLVGLAVIVITIPVPGKLGSLTRSIQKKKMAATDARTKVITENIGVLRMIKQFGYENLVEKQIAEKREEELEWIWKRKIVGFLLSAVTILVPVLHIGSTYLVFTMIMKQRLTASIVFSASTAFDLIKFQISRALAMYPTLIQARVSLDRLDAFLTETELLDDYSKMAKSSDAVSDEIGIRNSQFIWAEKVEAVIDGPRPFTLQIDGSLYFRPGAITMITGPTASGKTALIMALLGEMHNVSTDPLSSSSLPREHGIAFSPQETWIESATIKENIVFGSTYDDERYKAVLHQCALEHDLSLFSAGDDTEVGEKGITLSGGQKARITLARAIYSPAKTLLLDDVFAALDVHTAKWIIERCFRGKLVQDRTVLLVTHNVALVSTVAEYVVCMEDGRVKSQDTAADASSTDLMFDRTPATGDEASKQQSITADEKPILSTNGAVPAPARTGLLVAKEEISEGHVGFEAFKLFLWNVTGRWPTLWWIVFVVACIASTALDTIGTWYLGYWARQYQLRPLSEVSAPFYLGMWSFIVLAYIVVSIARSAYYTYGSLRASRVIHESLIGSILRSTFRFIDVTPSSRIIARVTQDIQAVDGAMSSTVQNFIQLCLSLAVKLVSIILFTPVFLLPGLFILVAGWNLGQIYMKAQLSVKREMSNAKAPVIGVFSAAIAGLPSIRAYGAQHMIRMRSHKTIDKYIGVSRLFFNTNRWISVRIDILSALFGLALGVYFVYGPSTATASTAGFSLSVAVAFSDVIISWVRRFNDLEVEGNSLERIDAYLNIDHEEEPKEDGKPPAYWPSSGELRVENLSARYSADGPKVLDNISFHVKGGERIGICGRTGSGKSSLALSLLRCILTEGTVYYDGIPTASLNLDDLRSKITIIPQAPELLSGTLRQNLDMFGSHDDAVLNSALRAAGLFALQEAAAEASAAQDATKSDARAQLTLDSPISSGGSNLSVGQRQIIALARAMVRESKLLILDEATSAIDYETDAVIQASLRRELPNDVTVLVVAHRLSSIGDSDKVMVLDAGKLVEFDSPKNLLRKHGLFKSLVDESADKDILYAMAEDKRSA